jgi:hypothetical protein
VGPVVVELAVKLRTIELLPKVLNDISMYFPASASAPVPQFVILAVGGSMVPETRYGVEDKVAPVRERVPVPDVGDKSLFANVHCVIVLP